MIERFVYLTFQIDTNRINASMSLPNMNRLEQWEIDDVIFLEISKKAQEEASQGISEARKRKANNYIYSETLAGTEREQSILRLISDILFPNGAVTQNQLNDVEIVFNAWKYKCILITNDGASKRQPMGILGNRNKLKELGITVMTDDEAVSLVEDAIRKRDERATKLMHRTGESLPDWVGKDF